MPGSFTDEFCADSISKIHRFYENALNSEGSVEPLVIDNFNVTVLEDSFVPLIDLLPWNQNHHLKLLIESTRPRCKKYTKLLVRNSSSTSRETSSVEPKKETNGIYLAGSPLECSFDVNDTDITSSSLSNSRLKSQEVISSEALSPLSVKDARNLWSKLYISSKGQTVSPLWIVCDGRDGNKTALLAFSRTEALSHRAVATANGKLKVKEFPKISKIKSNHALGVKDPVVATCVQASYSVSYIMLGSEFETDETSQFDSESKSNQPQLRLKCTWNSVSELLEWPASDASTTLQANVAPGNENSACYDSYVDFKKLANYVEALETGVVLWTGAEENVMDRLIEFAQSQKVKKRLRQESEPASPCFDDIFGMKVAGKRLELDFTDKLWEILTDCNNYESLVSCFSYIFSVLLDGDMYPFVFSKNNTGMANFIRESMRGSAKAPSLDGLSPLTLLIEIGIEKLKRDFLNFFMFSKISTLEYVNPLLPVCDSAFTVQLSQLHKILHVMDLITCCKTSLSLSKEVLANICRKCLEYYKGAQVVDSGHTFEFFLPRASLQGLNSRLDLETWTVHFRSADDTYEVNTIVNMSPKALFPFVEEAHDFGCDDEEINDNEEMYHMTTITSVTDRIF